MHLLTLSATGAQLAPPRQISTRRRRLSQVIGRHVDRTRPHMIAIQNARDVMQPIDEAWITRGWKVPPVLDREGNTVTPGVVKPWPRRYLRSDDLVVVVYLPRGGSSGAGGRGSKSPLKIALSIAAIALVAFSGPIGGAIAGALSITSSFGIAAVTAGVVVAGSALMGLASKSKANKTPTDETKVYGIQGGGNLPRPGDRIPRGYGRSWMKPDLSQPDFNQYDGDDLILTKRHTLGVGRYRVLALRAGKQVFWREGEGFVAPFNDPRNRVEFLYGTPSTLAPSNVVAASGVGGELPRLEDTPQYAGPFNINERGALINRIQWDFQFPSGISRVDFFKSGNSRANQPGEWGVQFEYAQIDDDGRVILPWMIGYTGNSGNEGPKFSTHPLRFTKFKDVPPGRYATRGVNVARDTSAQTEGNAHQNTANWDAASGWVGDVAVRELVTEIVVRLYATKSTGSAAFGEMEADAQAIIPVFNGTEWVEQETSKAVWAYCDVMRNQDYGGALPDNQVDRSMPKFYADSLTKFDTFDGTIRGPVSVFDAASTVLLPMRAEPVHLGRFWSLVRDDTKGVRKHMITRRQMVKGSTRISFDLDTTSGAAHVIGEYDRDGDYRNPGQAVAVFGEASLTPLRTMWAGVRTYEHAHHLTTWRAAIGAFRRQSIPFGVTLESRIYKRGDAITIDPWFVEGHSTAGVLELSGSTIRTDYDVPAKNGDWASFRDRRGREWGPVKVLGKGATPDLIRLDPTTIAQATTDTGTPIASLMDNGRGNMTTVRIGSLVILRESYLIQSVQMQGTKKATVTALIDDPRVWDAIGQDIVIPPDLDPGLAVVVLPRIVGLTANATQMAAGLRCDYAIRPGRGAVRFEVGVSYDGTRFETIDDADLVGSIPLNPVDPQTVTVRARAFGITGLPGPYFNTPLALGKSAVLGSLLDDFSVEFRSLSDYVRAQLDAVSDLGSGVLAEGHDATQVALNIGKDSIRGALRQIATLMDRMAAENATEIGNAYEARQLIKIGNDRNFAFIERVDEARIEDGKSFVATTTSLGNRLTSAEGNIVANGTAIFGLSSALDITNGNVESVQQAVTTLGGAVDLLDLDIKAEATARSLLETRVTEVDGAVKVVSRDLVTLDSTIKDRITGVVEASALAVEELKTEVTKVDGRVTSEASRTTALESTARNLEGDLGNTATALQKLTTRTETIEGNEIVTSAALINLEGALKETNEDVGATSQAVQQVSEEVSRVDGVVKSTAEAITVLDGKVGSVERDGQATARSVQTLEQTVIQVDGDLTTTSQAVTRLEGRIKTAEDDNATTASAVTLLTQEVSRVDGVVKSTAESISEVKTTADGAEASVKILAGSYDGIRTQYSVVLEQDGQTGGFILQGVKQLDGSPTVFEMRLRGDLLVERTITARNLILTEGLITVDGQLSDFVVSTRAVGVRQITNYAAGVGGGKSVDVMMNTRKDSFVFLIGYAVNGPQTEFSTTVQPGQIQIQIDDTSIINSIPNNFVSTGTGDSRRSRILTSSIMGFSAPSEGMHKFTLINTSSADVPGVVLFVMEFAR